MSCVCTPSLLPHDPREMLPCVPGVGTYGCSSSTGITLTVCGAVTGVCTGVVIVCTGAAGEN